MAKKLYRSRNQKIVAGVCGGIAEYFDLDPIFVRIFFVFAAFGWGGGFLLYIVLWFVMPFRTIEQVGVSPEGFPIGREIIDNQVETSEVLPDNSNKRTILGIILILVGSLMFIENFIPDFDFSDWWPIIFILVGAYLVFNALIIKRK